MFTGKKSLTLDQQKILVERLEKLQHVVDAAKKYVAGKEFILPLIQEIEKLDEDHNDWMKFSIFMRLHGIFEANEDNQK